MTNRSRLLPRLVAVLPVVVLVLGCQSGGQKAFRYPEPPPRPLVEIRSDCKAYPETVVEEYPERVVVEVSLLRLGHSRSQVLWHVIGKQAGDRVVISSKRAEIRTTPGGKPQAIQSPFPSTFEIPSSFDAIRSGSLKAALHFLQNKKASVLWTYGIEYYRDGKLLCKHNSPEVCIQKWGSNGCNV